MLAAFGDLPVTRTVNIVLGDRSYDVIIGLSARTRLPGILPHEDPPCRLVVIADERVANLHLHSLLEHVAPPPVVLTVPPGEASKSLDLARQLYDDLARQRIERRDIILTFGGGVVCDLGGFVAATWLRGVRFLQIPTTLEAAIDASVGGKTAVNHPAGKNLIGAFHQPIGVIVDTDFLATLPQRDFVAGLGESVKHAAISPGDFLDWHEAHAEDILACAPGALTELIARNCTIKAAIVSLDEREADLRAILNYGHTIGHALEHHFGYELRHGECVALGMLVVNEINCRRGGLDRSVAGRIAALISRLGLPTRLPRRFEPAGIARLCQADKKVQGGAVRFVLLAGLGSTVRAADITGAEIEQALAIIQP